MTGEPRSASRRLLVDVDGTVARHLPRVCGYVDEAYGVDLRPSDVTSWSHELPALGRTVDAVIDELLDDHPEWYLLGMEPVPNAADALRRLSAAGYRVAVATHRPKETHHLTRRWLDRRNLPYDEFVADVPPNKAAADGAALVDDYHGHVADATEAGKTGVLMNRPYSDPSACEDAHVAESWADVVSFLADSDAP